MSQAGIVDVESSHPQIPTEFVTNSGTAIPIANILEILGTVVSAHSIPLETTGSGNTVTVVGQYSSAAASSIANNAGFASFNSSQFSVDANGYVSFTGTGAGETITGNVGGALSPVAGNWNILGTSTASGATPVQTSGSGNTLTVQVQKSQAIASTNASNVGLAAFNSTYFTVDANGFVSLVASSEVASFTVDANTAPGTNPVVPNGSGTVTITGGQVAAGTTTNVLRTNSLAANTYTIQVQRSQAVASSTIGDNGVSHFNSSFFSVDSNGFVSLNGSHVGETITGSTGGALSPTSGNWNILGSSPAAGTTPVQTSGSGSTLTVQVQISQAIASTNASNIGLAAFNSSFFTVDANGFVSINGSGIGETITGNTGGALSPSSGNWNILGSSTAAGSTPVQTSGSGSTLTVQVQKAQAIASTSASNVGLAAFDSSKFSVDANGFVTLNASDDLHNSTLIVGNTSAGANYSTLSAAMTAASAGQTIFMQPGTYNIGTQAWTAGVNICAFDCDAYTPNVILNGKLTFSGAGTVSMSGCSLQTNSDYFLSVTGSSASVVNLINCDLNCLNNTGINYTTSSASASITCTNCIGNLGTTGIGFHTMSSTGGLTYIYCELTNTGSSTTASSNSAGVVYVFYCICEAALSSSSTGQQSHNYSVFALTGINTTCVTLTGTGAGNNSASCQYSSGSASAISVGSGCTFVAQNLLIYTSATNAITGGGTINFTNITYAENSSYLNNVTTQAGGTIQGLRAGNAPSAGYVGEQITSSATTVALSNASGKTITSISLTAGIWDVSGLFVVNGSTANITDTSAGISTTNNTISGNLGQGYARMAIGAGTVVSMTLPIVRATLSSTTTYYLVGSANFAAGSANGQGTIVATRVS